MHEETGKAWRHKHVLIHLLFLACLPKNPRNQGLREMVTERQPTFASASLTVFIRFHRLISLPCVLFTEARQREEKGKGE